MALNYYDWFHQNIDSFVKKTNMKTIERKNKAVRLLYRDTTRSMCNFALCYLLDAEVNKDDWKCGMSCRGDQADCASCSLKGKKWEIEVKEVCKIVSGIEMRE